ncbi:MAG: NAD(+) kinase [Gammaproteobacteria bacterium]|nr:MAG: NAD(+) kinase [Gammaproteobacteria bacterium]RLA53344.1 MAG: NAD(+) kinase [Gammaproteobacteria bacterium]
MSRFQNICVVARLRHTEVLESLRRLVAFLKTDGRNVFAEIVTAELLGDPDIKTINRGSVEGTVDLVIVVGGDGSMLGAARALSDLNVPLLGLNRGRLGFLTDIHPDEMEIGIGQVLAGKFSTTDRFLLEMAVERDGQAVASGLALNDFVLHPGKSVRMMELELYIDGQFVYSQRSDGLIVSTPTGSTAYALSAGGPIMTPELNAMVLVPMNAHTLSNRPIVVDGQSSLEILVGKRNELHPLVTCDGQTDINTEPGDVIKINRKQQPVRLIHPMGHNFYETCRNKLGWGTRLDSGYIHTER